MAIHFISGQAILFGYFRTREHKLSHQNGRFTPTVSHSVIERINGNEILRSARVCQAKWAHKKVNCIPMCARQGNSGH